MTPVASTAKATAGLSARFSATGLARATATIGGAASGYLAETASYPLVDIGYSTEITADDVSDVATLTLSTGVVAQTTGTPVISEGDGKDFEGNTLPSMAKLMAIRLRTPSANAAAVVIAGSTAQLPDITLPAGADVLLRLPAAGATVGADTLAFTFAAAGDAVLVDVLGADT